MTERVNRDKSTIADLITYLKTFEKCLFTDSEQYTELARVLVDHFPNDFRTFFRQFGELWSEYSQEAFDVILDDVIREKRKKKSDQEFLWSAAAAAGYKRIQISDQYDQIINNIQAHKSPLERDVAAYLNYSDNIIMKNELWYSYQDGVYRQIDEHVPYNRVADLSYKLQPTFATHTKITAVLKQWRNMACELATELPNMVNLQNGIYDLEKGKLLPHAPDRVSFVQLPFAYSKEAPQPKHFFKYLTFALDGDQKVIDEIQKFLGYCLISENNHQVALWLHGRAKSGKSTLAQIISKLVGDRNWTTFRLDNMDNRYETSSLIDKRLVWIDEITIKEFNMVSENRLKTMISGGTVVIEMKYKGQFSYRPQAKWVITGNELPRINDASDGFWRRILIIPFRNVIDSPDKDFVDTKILPELPGIFNWALIGLDRLRKEGFLEPEASKQVKEEWKEDSDPMRVFINDVLVVTGLDKDRVENDTLYDKYSKWCNRSGNKPLSSNHFSRRLAGLLDTRNVFRKKSNDRRYFSGVLVKTEHAY